MLRLSSRYLIRRQNVDNIMKLAIAQSFVIGVPFIGFGIGLPCAINALIR